MTAKDKKPVSGYSAREVVKPEGPELNSFEPWAIAQSEPRREAAAKISLERDGFEVYYPTYKELVTPPLRKVPPKKRHLAHLLAREIEQPFLRRYLFIRRLFSNRALARLYELEAVAGVCCFGEEIAHIPDRAVELLRLQAHQGLFDVKTFATSRKFSLAIAGNLKAEAMKQHTSTTRIIGRLAESDRTVFFLQDVFGRISRVIASPADQAA